MMQENSVSSPIKLSYKEALVKAEHFCAYQERCHQEVRDKLFSYGLYGNEVENMIAYLIENNYLNEERFSKTFARGKFNLKSWGKVKIKQALKLKRISPKLIELALLELDEEQYLAKLTLILEKKNERLSEKDPFKRRFKLLQYALQKGYEKDLILYILNINNLSKT